MNQAYSFKHWLATLFLAPFLPSLYALFFSPEKGEIIGLLEIYWIAFVFSFLFSLPTFVVYYFIFLLLIRKQARPVLTKIILIIWTVIGVGTTILIIGGSLSMTLILAYCSAAIITGIVLKIRTST